MRARGNLVLMVMSWAAEGRVRVGSGTCWRVVVLLMFVRGMYEACGGGGGEVGEGRDSASSEGPCESSSW